MSASGNKPATKRKRAKGQSTMGTPVHQEAAEANWTEKRTSRGRKTVHVGMDIDEPVPYVESTQQAGPSSGFAQIPEGPMGPGDMPDQELDHLDPYDFTYVEGESSTQGKVSNQLPLIYLSSSSVHRSGSSGKPNSFSNFPRTSTRSLIECWPTMDYPRIAVV